MLGNYLDLKDSIIEPWKHSLQETIYKDALSHESREFGLLFTERVDLNGERSIEFDDRSKPIETVAYAYDFFVEEIVDVCRVATSDSRLLNKLCAENVLGMLKSRDRIDKILVRNGQFQSVLGVG